MTANQFADAVNQGGKEAVAIIEDALNSASEALRFVSPSHQAQMKISKARSALASIKDQQAQPVDKDKRIAELEVQLVQNDDRYMEMGAKYEGIILDLKKKLREAAPVEQAHGAMPEPIAYLKFWAAQRITTDGDVDADEGFEVCRKDEIGADGSQAFPVYAAPQAPASKDVVAWMNEYGSVVSDKAKRDMPDTVSLRWSIPLTRCTETAQEQGRDGVIEECAKVCDISSDLSAGDVLGGAEGMELCRSLATTIRQLKGQTKT